MDADSLRDRLVTLPERAGDLQLAGDDAALVRELGDNYARYHTFLAEELERSPAPNPKDFRGDRAEDVGDPEAYARQAERFQRILSSELILRRARAHHRNGRSMSDSLLDHPPLIDADGKLVDTEHPQRARFVRPPAYQRLDEKPQLPDS